MNGKQKENSKFVSIGKAALFTGLCTATIRSLADSSKLPCYKTPSGQRRFNIKDLQKMCDTDVSHQEIPDIPKQNYIYARVSSKKQMDDLSRQIEYLKSINDGMYSSYNLVYDIGSGINFKRKGFNTILESCLQKNIGTIVVAHRDRLCRFGFELVESIILKSGGKLIVTDDESHKTTEQELSEDLMSIVHIYSCRQMGKRKYNNNNNNNNIINKNNEIEDISDKRTKVTFG
jgi:putative resolvase